MTTSIDTSQADRTIKKHNLKITIKPIKSEADYRTVAAVLVEVKEHLKALKKDGDEIIKPIRQGLDKLYAKFRDQRRKLEAIEVEAGRVMEAWVVKQQAKEIKKAQRKALKAPNAEMAADIIEAAREATPVAKVAGLSYRTDYDVEVIDIEKVPCKVANVVVRPVDVAALRRLAKATGGGVEIPGVRITKVKTVVGAAK